MQDWIIRLHAALDRELLGDTETKALVARALTSVYQRDVGRSGVQKRVPGVSRYTLDRVAPALRAELDRRIFAGVDLIRLNRRAAVEKTLARFSGWVSSVPPHGAPQTKRREVATDVGKSIARLKFEARRVATDQGHKLSAAVASVVALGEGAIGAIWYDRGEDDRGYDARPEHLKRSGTLFLIRNSWAMKDGLVKKGGRQYTDEIEQPAELPFCSCSYQYVTSPRDLPADLLTEKGRVWVGAGVVSAS